VRRMQIQTKITTTSIPYFVVYRPDNVYGGTCSLGLMPTLNLNTMAYDVSIKGHAVGVHRHEFVSVQVGNMTQTSTLSVLPVSTFGQGLLTRSFPNLPPAGSVDGNIQNADGTLNDSQHPAAPGSIVTLFATGLAGPGVIDLLWNAPLPQRLELLYTLPGTARHMGRFINALYAIDFRIPDSPDLGVYLVPVPGVLTRAEIGRVGSGLGVYVQ
jgi:hypothetical protein